MDKRFFQSLVSDTHGATGDAALCPQIHPHTVFLPTPRGDKLIVCRLVQASIQGLFTHEEQALVTCGVRGWCCVEAVWLTHRATEEDHG